MTRRGRFFAALFVTALVAAACGGDGGAPATPAGGPGQQGATGEPIKVGAIFDLSGATTQVGQGSKELADVYIKKVNDGGGVKGRPIQLMIEDGKSDQTAALQAAKRFIEQEKVVAILGPNTSSSALAIKEYVNGQKVPMIALAGASSIVTPPLPYIFKIPENDTVVAQVQLAYMKKQGVRRFGWLGTTSGFGQSGLQAFQAEAQRQGLQMSPQEKYEEADKDMSAQLTRIKDAGVDAVIIYGIAPGAAIAQKNAKDLGIRVPVYQSFGAVSAGYIQQAGDAAEGTVLASGKLPVFDQLPDSDPQKKSIAEFKTVYEKATRFAADAYDGINLLRAALENGGAEPQKVRDYLETQVKGFAGVDGVFTITPQDHNGIGTESIVVARFEGGKWKLLATSKDVLA